MKQTASKTKPLLDEQEEEAIDALVRNASSLSKYAMRKKAKTKLPKVRVQPSIKDTQEQIAEVCNSIRDLLIQKNRDYGDSALSPKRIFSRQDAIEAIKVRIDDKLSRIANDKVTIKEDTVLDLLGYLILLRVAQMRNAGDTDGIPDEEVDL